MKTVDELMALADAYAHCYAFVGDDSMPIARASLLSALQEVVQEQRRELANAQGLAKAWKLTHDAVLAAPQQLQPYDAN